MRCLQMKQRLYPAIHEAFYVYLITFSTGKFNLITIFFKKKKTKSWEIPCRIDHNDNSAMASS